MELFTNDAGYGILKEQNYEAGGVMNVFGASFSGWTGTNR